MRVNERRCYLADASGSLASGGEASHLPMLLDTLGDPLELGVIADGVVVGVDENDLEVLVGGVFTNPVGVHDSERTAVSTDSLLGNRLESSGELDEDTHVHGLTHGGSLGHWLLSSTSSDLDSVKWLNFPGSLLSIRCVCIRPSAGFSSLYLPFHDKSLLRTDRICINSVQKFSATGGVNLNARLLRKLVCYRTRAPCLLSNSLRQIYEMKIGGYPNRRCFLLGRATLFACRRRSPEWPCIRVVGPSQVELAWKLGGWC